ncbi:MAG: hypothetical protein CMH91_04850 [Oceanicaulis sp.]|jgi:8-oxo-dGTP pyrophosphatase MutT (NUDIX family)|nr:MULTISPECIES: hypothetical protein [unclassified Oceanicaulis]MAB68375.1 hypothetical protein [Oceanicaulis sp.]MBC38380.1 hypothetical protein [Oceanicaulis sp.]HBU61609.1 hypothetical protein [Oceanicaulis sp.]|tara:strand:+ start:6357 stop:6965 length:609 start_codon:yes stop_codon:yes gene_type:complete
MSARPINMATILLADPHSRQIALVRTENGYGLPMARPARGDGLDAFGGPVISRKRLGSPEKQTGAYMDAAIRALSEELGQLLARPLASDVHVPGTNPWARLTRHHLQPDRDSLTYLGRALDPADAETRRHVRVFTAPVARISNSVKRRGGERIAWVNPERAPELLRDEALNVFAETALASLGGRPRPLMVSFRAGQRQEVRL